MKSLPATPLTLKLIVWLPTAAAEAVAVTVTCVFAASLPVLLDTDKLTFLTGIAIEPSYAPVSTVVFKIRAKPVPRWSVLKPAAAALLPRLIKGLPTKGATVRVGPPLSASGERKGSAVEANVPWQLSHKLPTFVLSVAPLNAPKLSLLSASTVLLTLKSAVPDKNNPMPLFPTIELLLMSNTAELELPAATAPKPVKLSVTVVLIKLRLPPLVAEMALPNEPALFRVNRLRRTVTDTFPISRIAPPSKSALPP